MVNLSDIYLGQTVRGVFLDDEPTTIEGLRNPRYGTTSEFTGVVRDIDLRSFGGPYVVVDDKDAKTVYMCDVHEILEVLDKGKWYA